MSVDKGLSIKKRKKEKRKNERKEEKQNIQNNVLTLLLQPKRII